jgi:putative isomerase
MSEYERLKARLCSGWNTWNTRSVLSHVYLPAGFALNLGIKEYSTGAYLKEALVGRLDGKAEIVTPGPHAYDGSYTELTLVWKGIELLIQSATDGEDLMLLVTPLGNQSKPALLVAESGILWNRDGYTCLEDGELVWRSKTMPDIRAFGTKAPQREPVVQTQTAYLAMELDTPVGISTGTKRTLEEIRKIVEDRKTSHLQHASQYGELGDTYAAIQTSMAWDTIYDPAKDRVVSPVSRIWNCNNGGYTLFCWDNYFAAYLASLDHKDLAYANAIEITKEKTEQGFVPNCAWGNGFSSKDRSQPPVGSMVVRELYRKFKERWLLEEVYDDLLAWNEWWFDHRLNGELLSWGSDPYVPELDNYWETAGVNDTFGGALESGLDNSPMYDDIPFDKERHVMKLHDVGLNGLYIMDCRALADLAGILGRSSENEKLMRRADLIAERMQLLWDEESGIFLNRRTDNGEFSRRLSPTNFYALLGGAATGRQAGRMIDEHFYNPEEFWGEWIMPSIARNDPAYPEQDYWRGRIWAPMNFLVYLGMRNYKLAQAQADLVEKSKQLLLKEWLDHGHVHENYNADNGEGCDKPNSDRFYHWGALLGLISFIEEGYLEGPEKPIV